MKFNWRRKIPRLSKKSWRIGRKCKSGGATRADASVTLIAAIIALFSPMTGTMSARIPNANPLSDDVGLDDRGMRRAASDPSPISL
jgi:hypothetical protein